MSKIPQSRISVADIDAYKREVLEQSVLLSPREVAKVIGKSPSTVYDLAAAGVLTPHGRIGDDGRILKGVRFLASDVREYVRSLRLSPDTMRE